VGRRFSNCARGERCRVRYSNLARRSSPSYALPLSRLLRPRQLDTGTCPAISASVLDAGGALVTTLRSCWGRRPALDGSIRTKFAWLVRLARRAVTRVNQADARWAVAARENNPCYNRPRCRSPIHGRRRWPRLSRRRFCGRALHCPRWLLQFCDLLRVN
jgi:hypothetical protein